MIVHGLDYAAGRPAAANIVGAGYQFVVRYLTDGGPELPGKLLTPGEAMALADAGVFIVSNFETTADRALAGWDAGAEDAARAIGQVLDCGGRHDRPIYFSVDFDATPEQQTVIDEYLMGAASVISGEWVGIYAGYWPLKRALDAGTAAWGWQTQAWSGGLVDERAKLLQLNNDGYATIDGIDCDQNVAMASDYGQWLPAPPARFWPLSDERIITSGFGPRENGEFHTGMDFGRDGGSGDMPVYAIQAGTVIYAGAAAGYGGPDPAGWLVIDSTDAQGAGCIEYGHIVREVELGQRVEAGQRIAHINPDMTTNGGVAPHLHVSDMPREYDRARKQNPARRLGNAAEPVIRAD
jgi:murein DD-endopeptidase MepM/ murein hydrolase activator NlpD